jgi:hypothetical protein
MSTISDVRAKLSSIFSFYAENNSSVNTQLRSTRFLRFVNDSRISNIDQITVDLIFCKSTKNKPVMNFTEYLDAVSQLAMIKYPKETNLKNSLLKLYDDHLSLFENPSVAQTAQFNDDFYEVIKSVHIDYLAKLYMETFQNEVNPHFKTTSQYLTSQNQLIGLLTETKIIDQFLSKAQGFQIYREANKFHAVSVHFEQLGCVFTFDRFIVSLGLIGRALPEIFVGRTDDEKIGNVIRRLQKKPLIPQAQLARSSNSESGRSEEIFNHELRPGSKRIPKEVKLIFEYYAKLGDPLNTTTISSSKFTRILKDGGIAGTTAGECLMSGGFLSQTDIDMIFSQSTKNKMDINTFYETLTRIGHEILPALVKKGFVSYSGDIPDSWTVLNKCMIEPLSQSIFNKTAMTAGTAGSGEETPEIIQVNRDAINKVFACFSKKSVMTVQEMQKFAVNFGLEIPPLTLTKQFNLFKTGETIKLEGFEKLLCSLADKSVSGMSLDQKIGIFFHKLNNTIFANQLAPLPNRLFKVPRISTPKSSVWE